MQVVDCAQAGEGPAEAATDPADVHARELRTPQTERLHEKHAVAAGQPRHQVMLVSPQLGFPVREADAYDVLASKRARPRGWRRVAWRHCTRVCAWAHVPHVRHGARVRGAFFIGGWRQAPSGTSSTWRATFGPENSSARREPVPPGSDRGRVAPAGEDRSPARRESSFISRVRRRADGGWRPFPVGRAHTGAGRHEHSSTAAAVSPHTIA